MFALKLDSVRHVFNIIYLHISFNYFLYAYFGHSILCLTFVNRKPRCFMCSNTAWWFNQSKGQRLSMPLVIHLPHARTLNVINLQRNKRRKDVLNYLYSSETNWYRGVSCCEWCVKTYKLYGCQQVSENIWFASFSTSRFQGQLIEVPHTC